MGKVLAGEIEYPMVKPVLATDADLCCNWIWNHDCFPKTAIVNGAGEATAPGNSSLAGEVSESVVLGSMSGHCHCRNSFCGPLFLLI